MERYITVAMRRLVAWEAQLGGEHCFAHRCRRNLKQDASLPHFISHFRRALRLVHEIPGWDVPYGVWRDGRGKEGMVGIPQRVDQQCRACAS